MLSANPCLQAGEPFSKLSVVARCSQQVGTAWHPQPASNGDMEALITGLKRERPAVRSQFDTAAVTRKRRRAATEADSVGAADDEACNAAAFALLAAIAGIDAVEECAGLQSTGRITEVLTVLRDYLMRFAVADDDTLLSICQGIARISGAAAACCPLLLAATGTAVVAVVRRRTGSVNPSAKGDESAASAAVTETLLMLQQLTLHAAVAQRLVENGAVGFAVDLLGGDWGSECSPSDIACISTILMNSAASGAALTLLASGAAAVLVEALRFTSKGFVAGRLCQALHSILVHSESPSLPLPLDAIRQCSAGKAVVAALAHFGSSNASVAKYGCGIIALLMKRRASVGKHYAAIAAVTAAVLSDGADAETCTYGCDALAQFAVLQNNLKTLLLTRGIDAVAAFACAMERYPEAQQLTVAVCSAVRAMTVNAYAAAEPDHPLQLEVWLSQADPINHWLLQLAGPLVSAMTANPSEAAVSPGVAALAALAKYPWNCERLVHAGAVPVCVRAIADFQFASRQVVIDANTTLQHIVWQAQPPSPEPEARRQQLRHDGVLYALAMAVSSGLMSAADTVDAFQAMAVLTARHYRADAFTLRSSGGSGKAVDNNASARFLWASDTRLFTSALVAAAAAVGRELAETDQVIDEGCSVLAALSSAPENCPALLAAGVADAITSVALDAPARIAPVATLASLTIGALARSAASLWPTGSEPASLTSRSGATSAAGTAADAYAYAIASPAYKAEAAEQSPGHNSAGSAGSSSLVSGEAAALMLRYLRRFDGTAAKSGDAVAALGCIGDMALLAGAAPVSRSSAVRPPAGQAAAQSAVGAGASADWDWEEVHAGDAADWDREAIEPGDAAESTSAAAVAAGHGAGALAPARSGSYASVIDAPLAVPIIRTAVERDVEAQAASAASCGSRFDAVGSAASAALGLLSRTSPAAADACINAQRSMSTVISLHRAHAGVLWAAAHGSDAEVRAAAAIASSCSNVRWADAAALAAGRGRMAAVDVLLNRCGDGTQQACAAALRIAASRGHLDLLQHMIERWGVSLKIEGSTAMALAAECGHLHVVEALMRGRHVSPASCHGAPLWLAAGNGHLAVLELLLSDRRADPTSRFNCAIRSASCGGHLGIVARLLQDERVDPGAGGQAALALAAREGHIEVMHALLEDPRVDAEAFLRSHVQISERSLSVQPLPMLARRALLGKPSVARALLTVPTQAATLVMPKKVGAAEVNSWLAAAWRRRRGAVLARAIMLQLI